MTAKPYKSGHHPDYFLLAVVILLTVAGLLILASASSELGKLKFNDPYYFLKHQMTFGLTFGVVGFFLGLKIHYQFLRKVSLVLLLLNLALLILVFSGFGRSAGGATRWLQLGPLTFQPSELLKLSLLIYLAAWLTHPKINRAKEVWAGLLPFFVICAIIAGLLIMQPATSTVIILLLSGMVVYFLSGVPWKHILTIAALGLIGLGLLVWTTPYRLERVIDFLNPERDPQGSGYQASQALITVGSGGLFGMGYGKSTSKATTLPTPMDDAIFAVAAQELGFVGASTLVILFGLLVFRLFWLAKNLRDRFGQLLLVGFGSVIALQSLVNMAAMSGLIPLTGVPLPFVSYGGTALAVFLTMSGISLNISKYT